MSINRGFTLIEALIYLALFTLILGGIVVAAYALFETNTHAGAAAMLQEEKEYLLAKVGQVLDRADTVSLLSSSKLNVMQFGVASPVVITSTGGNLTIDGIVLNNTNVTVTGLTFTHTYLGGANPETVNMTFTLSAKTASGRDVTQAATLTRSIKH